MGIQCSGENCPVEESLQVILNELRSLKLAFPEDSFGQVDVIGHRQFHEAKIAAARAEEAFWRELKLDLVKKGLWALVVIFSGLMVSGIMVFLRGKLGGGQ